MNREVLRHEQTNAFINYPNESLLSYKQEIEGKKIRQ